MAFKKDCERIRFTATLKKANYEKLKELADQSNRPFGRMLDEIVERYQEELTKEGRIAFL